MRQKTEDLEAARLELIDRLATAAQFRDDVTGEHVRRVGTRSARLAIALGLRESEAELFRSAAPLHDVGKIGAPYRINLKPAELTPDEFDEVKKHSANGARILGGAVCRK